MPLKTSDSMTSCVCGNSIEQEGPLCARCTALHKLGLDFNATKQDIEASYRTMVKVWHPDRFQNDPKLKEAAEETLKSVNAAHAYLASIPEVEARKRPRQKRAAREVAMQPVSQARRRVLIDPLLASRILTRSLILLLILAVPALMLVGLDALLSSNPSTASFYGPYRSRLLFAMRTNLTMIEQPLHRLIPASATPLPAAQPANPDTSSASTGSSSTNSIPPPNIPMPYVTVGLTRNEVITVMGRPTSSTADSLKYRNAIFYFHKGVVDGWNVDPSLIPLRVKLWPSAHTDPRLTTFTIGSTRNDVIAVQGTPTLLSDYKLAYGSSEVFLDDGLVIGWNEKHDAHQLRIAPR